MIFSLSRSNLWAYELRFRKSPKVNKMFVKMKLWTMLDNFFILETPIFSKKMPIFSIPVHNTG